VVNDKGNRNRNLERFNILVVVFITSDGER